jgi:uncharacterized protein (TIGR03437 family)
MLSTLRFKYALLALLCLLVIPQITTSAAERQPLPKAVVTAEGVVNAAGYTAGRVSPGEIVVIFGTDIGPAEIVTLELIGDRVSTALGGVRVLFDGIPSPMVYALSTQVSAIVPYGIAGASSTEMTVDFDGTMSGPISLPVDPTVPGIFTVDASGTGQAAALNQDGTLNSIANPADINEIIVFYATGEGQTVPMGQDGLLALGSTLPKPILDPEVLINGRLAEILYAGAAPQLVAGVMQVNARVSPSTRSDPESRLSLRIDGIRNPGGVTVAVISQPDPLPPGVTTTLYGASSFRNPDFAGSVQSDQLLPFEIRDAVGTVIFAGNVQDRTVLSGLTGKLFFAPLIRDTSDAGSGAKITGFSKTGFAGTTVEVEFRPDGLGEVSPTTASRSADGDTITFELETPLAAPDWTRFVWIRTNAEMMASDGEITIRAQMPDGTRYDVTIGGTQRPL